MTTLGKIGIWFAHNAMSLADSVALARNRSLRLRGPVDPRGD